MTRAVVISNPNASRVRKARLEMALARLKAGGIAVDVARTSAPGEGARLAREAASDGADLLITHGGDGTLMELAPVWYETGRPLGILPAGTGNRLADNLGIPWAPRDAADVILAARPRAIDLGRIVTAEKTGYFAVCGGCGFDAEVMHRTSAATKRTWGVAAYVATAVGLAMDLPRAHLRVEADGQVLEREAVTVLLANCGEILPTGVPFSPNICYDDGVMDVFLLDAAGMAGAARIAWRLATGRSEPDESVTLVRAHRVKITSEPSMPAQADGEPCGRTPLDAEMLAGALNVLAPAAR